MAHRKCLEASLSGIEGVRTEPDKFFCARYDENGATEACYTLFTILPHEREKQLHAAVTSILWPEVSMNRLLLAQERHREWNDALEACASAICGVAGHELHFEEGHSFPAMTLSDALGVIEKLKKEV